MSGHSKWATIHRAKEAKDAKKGAAFTKLAMNITVAVRQGGGIGDPDKNFKLRLAVDKARQFNMPKENIARAIEKGMGTGAGVSLEEVAYEGFLPGGCAVVLEGLTDNKARTVQQVRSVLEKGGGTMAGLGAVSYMFSHVGEVIVDLDGKSMDELELLAIDCGASDLVPEGDRLVVYCGKDKPFEVKEKLESAGFRVESTEVVMKPEATVGVADAETREKIEALLEQLDELDDISKVWTNYGGE
jgi:YebC/PmpR family DNA-binding regulatory protein